jgi:TPR repeat protein
MHSVFIRGWKYQKSGNIDKALMCYKQAKNEGDKCALFHWTCMDRYGQYLPMNCNNADDNTFKLSEEEIDCLYSCYKNNREPEIQLNLGILCDHHNAKDQAVKYLEASAMQSYGPAQNYLGNVYQNLHDSGPALKWYIESANNDDPRGQYNLGQLYYHGIYIYQSHKLALRWWITDALLKYIRTIRPDFSQHQIDQWFQDLFAED